MRWIFAELVALLAVADLLAIARQHRLRSRRARIERAMDGMVVALRRETAGIAEQARRRQEWLRPTGW